MSTDTLETRLIEQGMPLAAAASKARLHEQCMQTLDANHSAAERLTFCIPGRIELLGKHTDYAGGRSLLCALDRGFIMVAAPRIDTGVHVTDVLSGETCLLSLDPGQAVQQGDWSNYVATVARRLARNFPHARRGADITIASDLPAAAGMSSSSALMVGIFLVLAAVNELRGDPHYRSAVPTLEALAAYLAAVENGQSFGEQAGDSGVGTQGGSEDHTAILCCRAGQLSQYEFRPLRLERVTPWPAGFSLVVAFSGVAAAKTGSAKAAYNDAAAAARNILRLWNENTGRSDVSLGDAMASDPVAPDRMRAILERNAEQRLLDRYEQFMLETYELVPRAADAFATSKLNLLGEVVDRSQCAAETLLGNQVPQTIALAQLARNFGAFAASAFGAGFGGSVWALVRSDDADRFAHEWREGYSAMFPEAAARATFFPTEPGPGALSWLTENLTTFAGGP